MNLDTGNLGVPIIYFVVFSPWKDDIFPQPVDRVAAQPSVRSVEHRCLYAPLILIEGISLRIIPREEDVALIEPAARLPGQETFLLVGVDTMEREIAVGNTSSHKVQDPSWLLYDEKDRKDPARRATVAGPSSRSTDVLGDL